jgi:Zn-dependent M28 family amino/carboxypeptidase
MKRLFPVLAPFVLAVVGCGGNGIESSTELDVDPVAIETHIQQLASDEMEGRAPGTAGEELATNYIAEHFRSIGLDTSFQDVPLVGTRGTPTELTLTKGAESRTMAYRDDFMAWTTRETASIALDPAEIIFAGYGTVAPEYDWNDFEGYDVDGKVLLLLVGDPPLEDGHMFGGEAMTYYGRWTYKYEEAARQGARGAFIVHETVPAGYPWDVVSGSWSGEQFDMVKADQGASETGVQGWITREAAGELAEWAGHSFEDLKQRALDPEFRPVPFGVLASLEIENTLRRVDSKNVVGVMEGETDEYVVFSSHWDHIGRDESLEGDQIYNGAVDNASGMAVMMEIARAFTEMATRPRRALVFLAVTAEEQGLLGSKYYAENPLFPLERTVANINIDGANVYRKTDEIVVVGYGYTSIENTLRGVASEQGRTVVPDPESEKGFYYRSDQFNFAKKGVPALYIDSTSLEDSNKYTADRYHKPADEFDPSWNLEGAVLDAETLIRVVLELANSVEWPEWMPGTEFKAIRDEMLRQ